MPVGFPAYQEAVERFRGLSRKDLLRAADIALDELGWRPDKIDRWRLRASVPFRLHVIFLCFGAKFTVEVDDGEIFVRSEGAFPLEWMDVGQHGDNLRRFLDRLDDVLDERE